MPENRSAAHVVLFAFDAKNRVLLTRPGPGQPWAPTAQTSLETEGMTAEDAATDLAVAWAPESVRPTRGFSLDHASLGRTEVYFLRARPEGAGSADRVQTGGFTLEELSRMAADRPDAIASPLPEILPRLLEQAVRIGYLDVTGNDYIYRFRTDRQRNRSAYLLDQKARDIYQSDLCEAIKRAKRSRERTSAEPAILDFGPVRFVLPSHFGFCLGVQNAIERAYETLGQHPDRRVFMLSELIHNPFVNEDLQARGLLYVQTDKGVPVDDPVTGQPYWESLNSDDIVIIPAFGATDEDKKRLVGRGIEVQPYDATCMLVEKVWKVARKLGQEGYSVIIHGKAEHEETRATFSNTAPTTPTLIIRNLEEAGVVGEMILEGDPDRRLRILQKLKGQHTPGFDPSRDLDRVAVVNQTTLLRNETIGIIDYLESIYARKYGRDQVPAHFFSQSRGDTLCYATQVNQDALSKALETRPDVAIVVGGKNSSNTFQLYRLCAKSLGDRASYIQSEANILSGDTIRHFRFAANPGDPLGGLTEDRPFLPDKRPLTILVTGGASCPDGIIQKIIERVIMLLSHESLRSIDDVLRDAVAWSEA